MSTQTTNAATTSNAQGQGNGKSVYYKRYNLQGVIAELVVRQTADNRDVANFVLKREGKKDSKCVAFAEKAEALLSSYNEGDSVRLFGFFKPESFTPEGESKPVTFQKYHVLWSGAPKTQADAEQADKQDEKAA
ncbi:hypothetical protein CKO28_02810 [Rhodovibrio sodomensis]|uniref:Single-stranded DNA-binding protein n=1 Tax=Rhodovibrio sodomensis TaxID=1088 RepID=A0ABS1D981_9PROT|nr:hypothetical protein [Rhodovibrio sodomensis]MBK1666973.1 hypothetical protein [Rhodovibrio sodomensis]